MAAERPAMTAGENRSGSGKKMSTPRTRGWPSAMRATRSATLSRDQGHWPCRASAFSSISTTTTMSDTRSRGMVRW